MAKNSSVIKFRGAIGGLVGVQSREGFHYRFRKDIPESRYKNAPEFESMRINGAQFGQGSQIRRRFVLALNGFQDGAANSRMYSRLNAVMQRIIKCDNVSGLGQFTVVHGIATDKGKAELNGFEFNRDCHLSSVLRNGAVCDVASGEIKLKDFSPSRMATPPVGATHVRLQAGFLRYDFATDANSIGHSEALTYDVTDRSVNDVILTCEMPAGDNGTLVLLLKVLYFQEVNGVLYELMGEKGGAMQVVGVI